MLSHFKVDLLGGLCVRERERVKTVFSDSEKSVLYKILIGMVFAFMGMTEELEQKTI